MRCFVFLVSGYAVGFKHGQAAQTYNFSLIWYYEDSGSHTRAVNNCPAIYFRFCTEIPNSEIYQTVQPPGIYQVRACFSWVFIFYIYSCWLKNSWWPWKLHLLRKEITLSTVSLGILARVIAWSSNVFDILNFCKTVRIFPSWSLTQLDGLSESNYCLYH